MGYTQGGCLNTQDKLNTDEQETERSQSKKKKVMILYLVSESKPVFRSKTQWEGEAESLSRRTLNHHDISNSYSRDLWLFLCISIRWRQGNAHTFSGLLDR